MRLNMKKKEQKYRPGYHPNSLANLTSKTGRKPEFGARKKTRGVTLTDEAWEKLQLLASEHSCSSVSDLVERISRGLVEISTKSA